MFEGLNLATHRNSRVGNGISFEFALENAANSCMDVLTFSNQEDSQLQATIENLVALEEAIEKFGMPRALVAFADYNKVLSSAIASMPALENMRTDLSVADSVSAVEGIKHVLKSMGASALYDVTHLFNGFNSAEKRIIVWKDLLDGVEEDMKTKEFNINQAIRTECRIVPFQGLITLQRDFTKAPRILFDMWGTNFPTDEENFKIWSDKIRSEIGGVFKASEAKITDKGTLTIPFERYVMLKTGEKGNLKAKGYTSDESVKEIITGFRRLLQAYLELKDLQGKAKSRVRDLKRDGVQFDRAVASKAVKFAKNITHALMFEGLWGVSGMSMYAINHLQKAYTHSGDYEGEVTPKE